MSKLVIGQNDLVSYCKTHSLEHLLEEWDYEGNNKLPSDYSYGSDKSVLWKCPKCGEAYLARINLRVHGSGCRTCGALQSIETRKKNSLQKGSLATEFPEIALEWDYDLNPGSTPENVKKASHDKVMWKCPKGHPSYPARIANRVYKGDGCPICGGRKILVGYNDLATVYPYLAAQWDYSKNTKKPTEVFPREGNSYYWICPICKESYLASVSNRSAGKNHKKCSQKGTSFPEQAIFYYVKQLFPDATNRDSSHGFELDVFIPSANTAIEFDGALYHKSPASLTKDNNKDALCESLGIKLFRLRDPSLPKTVNAVQIACVDDGRKAKLDGPIKLLLEQLSPNNNPNVNTVKDYYSILSASLLSLEKKSIVYTHPELVAEWHPTLNLPLTPDKVTSGMGIKVWWKCSKCGEEYQSFVYSRKAGNGCSKCAIETRRIARTTAALKKNSLVKQYPELIEEILPEDNPGINVLRLAAGSKKPIVWTCKICGHKWPASINHRTRGDGCPKCGRERTKKAAKRPVINLDTGEVFDSLKAAAESCGGDKRVICTCCQGKTKTAYGYHWKYQDPKNTRERHTGMQIHNIDTGEIFRSIQEAANKYECDRSSISAALRGKTKTSQGCHWEFINEE